MSLSITIEGTTYNFPLSKQQKRLHTHITNRVWTDHDTPPPEDKIELWEEKGYSSIISFAQDRAEQKGETLQDQLHSTRWYVAFNQPSVYVLYTHRINDYYLGLLKFLTQRGTIIALEDNYHNFKEIIPAAYNLYEDPLFFYYKVEEYYEKIDTLNPEIRDKVKYKYNILQTKRQQTMEYDVWPRTNGALQHIIDAKNIDDELSKREKLRIGQRYGAINVLKEYNTPTPLNELQEGKQLYEEIIRDLEIWSRPFGYFNLKLYSTDPNINTYKLLHEYRHSLNEAKNTIRKKSSLDSSGLPEILRAYIHIQYLKEQPELFLENDWMICRCCQYPMHVEAEYCDYCDDSNDNAITSTELLSSDIVDVNIQRSKKL